MQHLQYNPSQCIECGNCLLCPAGAISSVQPLSINNNCIDCEQCINACPKGQKVLRIAHNDELGGGWISPFGYQASTNPSEPKKDDTTSENPSKPSNPSDKDSNQEPSTDNPTTPTNPPTTTPDLDSIYAPPPTKYKQA